MVQSTHLTGISSPRFRRCSVDEEARVLFSKFLLLLSCFTFSMIAPQTFSKTGVSHVPSVSKAHSLVLGIQIFTTRRWVSKNRTRLMNIWLSKGAWQAETQLGLLAFTSCFSCITFCKKLLKGMFFGKSRFINGVKAVLQSQSFFLRQLKLKRAFEKG